MVPFLAGLPTVRRDAAWTFTTKFGDLACKLPGKCPNELVNIDSVI